MVSKHSNDTKLLLPCFHSLYRASSSSDNAERDHRKNDSSDLNSTWSTPTPDRQVCAPASPQVLSAPDDMVNTSKCIDSVCVYPCGERFAIQFPSTPCDCTHKLERKHIHQLCTGCIQIMMDLEML